METLADQWQGRRGLPRQAGATAAFSLVPLPLPAPGEQLGRLGRAGGGTTLANSAVGGGAAIAGSTCSGIKFQHFSDENKSASLLLCLAFGTTKGWCIFTDFL